MSTLARILEKGAPNSSLRDQDATRSLEHALVRAEKLITQITDLIKKRLVKNPDSLEDDSQKVEIRTAQWFLEERNLNTMTARLSAVKQSLQAALSVLPASVMMIHNV